MATRLEFSTAIDSSGYAAGIRAMEGLSAQAGSRMSRALAGTTAGYSMGGGSMAGHGGRGGVIGEAVVLARELGRGNYSHIGSSITILAQRMGMLKLFVKDNALAAVELTGAMDNQALRAANLANWTQETAVASRAAYAAEGGNVAITLASVDADESAAVAARVNAEAMREKAVAAKEAEGAAGMSISTMGIVAIALIAVGVATYYLIKHFRALAIEQKNVADLTDITTHTFSEQAKALKSAAEVEQAEIDRLKARAESQKGVKDAIDATLKSMREHAKLEQELATAKGGSKGQIAAMEIAALGKELEFMQAQIPLLERKLAYDNADEVTAAARLADFKSGDIGDDNETTMTAAAAKAAESADVVTALKNAMGTTMVNSGKYAPMYPGQTTPTPILRSANETDILSVKVGGKTYPMSVKAAIAAHEKDTAEAERLARIQKEMADILAQKTKLSDEDLQRLNSLKSEAEAAKADLGLKSEFLPQIAAASARAGGIGKSAGDSLVKVGNFLGSSKGHIETLAAQHVQIARQTLAFTQRIEQNTRRVSKPPGENHFPIH